MEEDVRGAINSKEERQNFNVSKELRLISNYVVVEGLRGKSENFPGINPRLVWTGICYAEGPTGSVIHARIIAPFCDVPNFLMCPAAQEES